MSYDPQPGSNPYAAPETDLIFPETGQKIYITGYAGFWRRFAAIFLDSILLYVVNLIVGLPFGIAVGLLSDGGRNDQLTAPLIALMVLMYGVVVAVNIGYFVVMETSASQATLGKMALGIKVCNLQGRRISKGQAFGRYFGKIISSIFMIGYIMAAFTEKKQALHDMMAGTLVVKAR